MILYASQRAHAQELAKHLLNLVENDHVTVHEIRGFVSDDLAEALREAEAISRGTRCRQFLFSVSLNPPDYADVPIEDFEAAIEEIERKMALVNQPRIIVFHEKKGRRHCHVVWSRIDVEKLVAVNMAHFKRKLMEISRYQFLKHSWKMPEGMKRAADKSPWALTREEYRQSVRLSQDGDALKMMFKGAWEQSDSLKTFAAALQERGFLLARGDRRGFVAVDVTGGVYSLTRWIDIGTRELKARLGRPEDLPDIAKATAFIQERMGENLQRYVAESRTRAKEVRKPLVQEIRALVLNQRKERAALIERIEKRRVEETKTRMARIPRGVRGIWQRATGAYRKIRILNEAETRSALARDRKELHALVRSHILERQELQKTVTAYKDEHKAEELRIRKEIAQYVSTATALPMAQPPKPDRQMLTVQLEKLESRIASLSGSLVMLQAAAESEGLSDDMRVQIRRMIEKTLETLHLKAVAEKEQETAKKEEYAHQQAELYEYVRRYAEVQQKLEIETRKIEANRQFYSLIMNMGYSLNGIPRWQISVMSPPPVMRLDEKAFTAGLRQKSSYDLLSTLTKPYVRPKIDPPMATVNLRSAVLEAKEILHRAGLRPDGGKVAFDPKQKIKMTTPPPKASARFNGRNKA